MGVSLHPLNRGVDFTRENAFIFFVKESEETEMKEIFHSPNSSEKVM